METQIPGGVYLNESDSDESQIPGGSFVNETYIPPFSPPNLLFQAIVVP